MSFDENFSTDYFLAGELPSDRVQKQKNSIVIRNILLEL